LVDGLGEARGGVTVAGVVGRSLDFAEGQNERFREVVAFDKIPHPVEVGVVVAGVGSGQDLPGSVEMIKAGEELVEERLADAAEETRAGEVKQGYVAHR
jgi:hypothetical protein